MFFVAAAERRRQRGRAEVKRKRGEKPGQPGRKREKKKGGKKEVGLQLVFLVEKINTTRRQAAGFHILFPKQPVPLQSTRIEGMETRHVTSIHGRAGAIIQILSTIPICSYRRCVMTQSRCFVEMRHVNSREATFLLLFGTGSGSANSNKKQTTPRCTISLMAIAATKLELVHIMSLCVCDCRKALELRSKIHFTFTV